ncbi:uncharacterized protein LOC127447698 [Myxocyprinus asiaticus]|uniref:uncharacterized protein LOC127447698 n=1 Tax=Myxocyprinus asiaticus TaxID=70543 RepID=UPI00222269A6|nr:uncharacterized protein LOC127447698 [Myxocyprinus asiaticus]
MTDRFILLTLCFSLILQNVDNFDVSEPLNHTLNEDGSVSVICKYDGQGTEWDAELKMNNECVCKLYKKEEQTEDKMCDWDHENNTFKFTLKKLEARHKDQLFSCEISRIRPYPLKIKEGKKTKLFPGVNIPYPPSRRNCPSIRSSAELMNHTSPNITSPGNNYTIVILGLSVVVVLLSLYSIILTCIYIRLRLESSDTLTYVPMQRRVKRYDVDNTEYMDMREVQKQGGSIRDMNHNSHPIR